MQVKNDASLLSEAILARTATVAVVGLGYVGLPLLVAVSAQGFPMIGLDSNRRKIRALEAHQSYIVDVSTADLERLDKVRFVTKPEALRDAHIVIIAVPTPLAEQLPDLTFVQQACSSVAATLQAGSLVILESTTYPGTTEEVVRPILEASGLEAGRDFYLAYSPERIDPGSPWTIRNTPKIVSGIGQADADLAELFYSQFVSRIVRTPTPREAEMAKLIENTFRQVNIALVNELAMLAPDLDVDIWEALDAAATKPFGYMPFWPGPGVGGHCIAIDPTYLSWRAGQRRGFGIRFIEHAEEINSGMPTYVAIRIGDALNQRGKPIKGSRLLAIGLSYKAGVNDIRESPALSVIEQLARSGAICSYHDPFIPSTRLFGEEVASKRLDQATLASQDCVVILTAHREIDYEVVVGNSALVFDAQGVTRGMQASNIVRL